MTWRRKLTVSLLVAACVLAGLCPAAALADERASYDWGQDGYGPPEPKYSPQWLAIFFGLLATALILAAGFKHARRSHLD